jgi:hypothetical protein|tara:strand:- start:1508 stop:1825 length:318 start_codon:yes stop_codon:yes gene_type:complete
MAVDKTTDVNNFIADVLERRGAKVSTTGSDKNVTHATLLHGNNGIRLLELFGAEIIEPTSFEPDPSTYRNEHYYNANTNRLYKKVISRSDNGVIVAHWEGISNFA